MAWQSPRRQILSVWFFWLQIHIWDFQTKSNNSRTFHICLNSETKTIQGLFKFRFEQIRKKGKLLNSLLRCNNLITMKSEWTMKSLFSLGFFWKFTLKTSLVKWKSNESSENFYIIIKVFERNFMENLAQKWLTQI